jgi:hypothetical protein
VLRSCPARKARGLEVSAAALELPASPEERTFQAHLLRPEFQFGVATERWRVIGMEWPIALIAVSAAERGASPTEFVLRFDLTGYPNDAPTAIPFDLTTNARLAADKLPKGPRLSGNMAFRPDWPGLYLPVDRSALSGHAWRTWRWDNSRDITYYLRLVHELLNAEDYEGV